VRKEFEENNYAHIPGRNIFQAWFLKIEEDI
jgi:hypothetical protein